MPAGALIDENAPRRGEIYYIDLSTDAQGHEQMGPRPAVVVSNDIANALDSVVLVAPITSQPAKWDQPWDVKLQDGDPLPRGGRVLCSQLRAVDRRRLERKVGKLSPVQMAALEQALKVALGIDGTV